MSLIDWIDKLVQIPGRLTSVAVERVVCGAYEVYDDILEKRQSELNSQILVSLKGMTKVIHITEDINLSESPDENTQTDVIIINDDSVSHIIGISNVDFKTPDGQIISFSVPSGGYAEANFLNINGIIYVRGI